MKKQRELIEKLNTEKNLTDSEFLALVTDMDRDTTDYITSLANSIRKEVFGNNIYIRGLIEVSNYCRKDCYYCGIRCSNSFVSRYRLSSDDILGRCAAGYDLGFRTFVLQGGEDPELDDNILCHLISSIKEKYDDCAVTLSLGERSKESYRKLFSAGADRYLLRHETADKNHYGILHPSFQSFDERMECLYNLKETGFQTGCGLMVGSPEQTPETLVKDLRFIREFNPEMVGIGPFLPASDTPFENMTPGSVQMTLKLLSIVRIMLPNVLLPATTALCTSDKGDYRKGILAGANVIMPNLTPDEARKKYLLYNGKSGVKDTTEDYLTSLKENLETIGCEIVADRGDYRKKENNV